MIHLRKDFIPKRLKKDLHCIYLYKRPVFVLTENRNNVLSEMIALITCHQILKKKKK